jgi:hypothetical protein
MFVEQKKKEKKRNLADNKQEKKERKQILESLSINRNHKKCLP